MPGEFNGSRCRSSRLSANLGEVFATAKKPPEFAVTRGVEIALPRAFSGGERANAYSGAFSGVKWRAKGQNATSGLKVTWIIVKNKDGGLRPLPHTHTHTHTYTHTHTHGRKQGGARGRDEGDRDDGVRIKTYLGFGFRKENFSILQELNSGPKAYSRSPN